MEEKTESLHQKAENILSQYGDEQIINRSTAIEAIKEIIVIKDKEISDLKLNLKEISSVLSKYIKANKPTIN